jgi:hypothetical protein
MRELEDLTVHIPSSYNVASTFLSCFFFNFNETSKKNTNIIELKISIPLVFRDFKSTEEE